MKKLLTTTAVGIALATGVLAGTGTASATPHTLQTGYWDTCYVDDGRVLTYWHESPFVSANCWVVTYPNGQAFIYN